MRKKGNREKDQNLENQFTIHHDSKDKFTKKLSRSKDENKIVSSKIQFPSKTDIYTLQR